MRQLHIVTDATSQGTRVYDEATGRPLSCRIVIEPTMFRGELPDVISITNIEFPADLPEPEPKACANCRWWDGAPGKEGSCELASANWGDGPKHPNSKAHAWADASFWWAQLDTASDFYCSQHEPREVIVHADDDHEDTRPH